MRRVFVWIGRLLAFLILTFLAIWALGPRDRLDVAIAFDASKLPGSLDTYLSTRELIFSDITPGTEKRIVWAGQPEARTPLAIVYLHGFSATSEEIRPLPDDVAAALGANLYFTRLAGHGRDGAALAAVTPEDWVLDLDEALAIGRQIGDRVILIGTSTGGTLAALAAVDPARAEGLAGVVLVSPNFRLAPAASVILDLPWARKWGPWVAGAEQDFPPRNEDHARFWTMRYPTTALFPMATLTRAVRAMDFAEARVPALFLYAPEDQVCDQALTAGIAAVWGAPTVTHNPVLTDRDDPYRHVVAGRILSPDQTAPLTGVILDWATAL